MIQKALTNKLAFAIIYMAAEISFIADVGGPLSPHERAFSYG